MFCVLLGGGATHRAQPRHRFEKLEIGCVHDAMLSEERWGSNHVGRAPGGIKTPPVRRLAALFPVAWPAKWRKGDAPSPPGQRIRNWIASIRHAACGKGKGLAARTCQPRIVEALHHPVGPPAPEVRRQPVARSALEGRASVLPPLFESRRATRDGLAGQVLPRRSDDHSAGCWLSVRRPLVPRCGFRRWDDLLSRWPRQESHVPRRASVPCRGRAVGLLAPRDDRRVWLCPIRKACS